MPASAAEASAAEVLGPGPEASEVRQHHPHDDDDDEEEEEEEEDDQALEDCGFLSVRPSGLQRLATIQVFVLLCCILVTLNQALSSGYFNSVITTIEKRFDISSRMTGLIVSTFEIGNLVTVIFVSYFGTQRHIPQWIGKGIVVTAVGSLVFAVAHFTPQDQSPLGHRIMPLTPGALVAGGGNGSSSIATSFLDDNICHPAALETGSSSSLFAETSP